MISFILSTSQIKKVIPNYDLSEDVNLALDRSKPHKVPYTEAAGC